MNASKRGLLYGLGAGALTIAVAATAPALAQTKLMLGDLAQSLNGIASNVMIQQGFDKKHGIDVEYRTYPTLDGLFTAIRGKQVDVGFGGCLGRCQIGKVMRSIQVVIAQMNSSRNG